MVLSGPVELGEMVVMLLPHKIGRLFLQVIDDIGNTLTWLDMPQNVRTFKCPFCNFEMQRDLHSANRMVQEGRKLVPQELREFMSPDWSTSIPLKISGCGKSSEMTGEAATL